MWKQSMHIVLPYMAPHQGVWILLCPICPGLGENPGSGMTRLALSSCNSSMHPRHKKLGPQAFWQLQWTQRALSIKAALPSRRQAADAFSRDSLRRDEWECYCCNSIPELPKCKIIEVVQASILVWELFMTFFEREVKSKKSGLRGLKWGYNDILSMSSRMMSNDVKVQW